MEAFPIMPHSSSQDPQGKHYEAQFTGEQTDCFSEVSQLVSSPAQSWVPLHPKKLPLEVGLE